MSKNITRNWKLTIATVSLVAFGALGSAFAQSETAPSPSVTSPSTETPAVVPGPSDTPADQVEATSDWRASALIGVTMTNALDQSVGTVRDLLVDSDGRVVALLVSVGGFLGLGERTVPIALRHVVITRVDADHVTVKTSLSRDAIDQSMSPETLDNSPMAQEQNR